MIVAERGRGPVLQLSFVGRCRSKILMEGGNGLLKPEENAALSAPSLLRGKLVRKYGYYYAMLFPALLGFLIFNYFPMYGVTMAFKDFRFIDGLWNSPWVGMKYFNEFFESYYFWRVLRNTLGISLLKLVFGFPAPIVLALLFNELFHEKFKKVAQTLSYLPYFMSWVVLAGIFTEIFSPSRGVVNYVLSWFNIEPIYFLASPGHFINIVVLTYVWQSVGWGTIIFLAAIAGINQESYEAATIDGANRYQQMVHITLPSLLPVITIVFIINLGGILSAGFDQIFNLYNTAVLPVADIIDTYVYRMGIVKANYSFAAAVGFFQNIIGLILVLGANVIVKRFNNHGIW